MMTEITENKFREILTKSQLAKNLSRKKLIQDIIFALIECKNVQMHEIFLYIKGKAKKATTNRPTQAFFKKFQFDYTLL